LVPGRTWGRATTTKAVALGLAMGTGIAMLSLSPAFAQSPPTVTAVIASSGPTAGGQQVTVEGTNLASPSAVHFGAAAATITASTASTVTVTEPAGTAGTVDVTVTTAGGTSATSSADYYTFGGQSFAYVADEGSGTVTPIAVATNTPGTPITVGRFPSGIAITPNGQTAFVANYGSGTVTPITVATNTADTPINVGTHPVAIAITPNGLTAYVVNYGSYNVTPITIATNTAGTPINVGDGPDGIAITPNGLTAYVTNSESGNVTPITMATNTAGTPITVGDGPDGIAITPNGLTAYVANSDPGTVTPITIATNTAGTPITVGGGPGEIAITPNGLTAYVTNAWTTTVTPITVATNTAGTPITVGSSPGGIAITPDGQTAYVTNEYSGTVTPIAVATNTAGTPITVGSTPAGIAITPSIVSLGGPTESVATDNGSEVTDSLTIMPGDRTATLGGDIAFPPVDASHSDVTATAQSTSIEANDLSATYAGWNVTVVASALAGSGGVALAMNGSIAADNLSVASYGALSSNPGDTTGVSAGDASPIGTPVVLLSAAAGSGVGDYTQAFDLGLVVPADSPAGDYSGTLTVTIAPPS
jgi:YVTN family beta-propeller protein